MSSSRCFVNSLKNKILCWQKRSKEATMCTSLMEVRASLLIKLRQMKHGMRVGTTTITTKQQTRRITLLTVSSKTTTIITTTTEEISSSSHMITADYQTRS